MRSSTRPSVRHGLARFALAALLFAMAAGQVSNPAGFVDILVTYRVGGTAAAVLLALAVVGGELAAAIGLVSTSAARRHEAASVALAVAVAWSALGLQAFARGLSLDNCGCFGVHLGQPLRGWVLLQDAEFVALAWWVRARDNRSAAVPGPPSVEATRS